jgi:uncharacterized membrane protein
VGIGFVVTIALGILLLGEELSAHRVAGTVPVAIGVILVARGS